MAYTSEVVAESGAWRLCSSKGMQMDLLEKLMARESRKLDAPASESEDPGGIELSLGLSLGGCFSGEKKKLGRASSVIDLSMIQSAEPSSSCTSTLNRWSSLPVKKSWLESSLEFGILSPDTRDAEELSEGERMEAKRQRLVGALGDFGTSGRRRDEESKGGETPGKTLEFSCRFGELRRGKTSDPQKDLRSDGHFPVASHGCSSSGASNLEAQTSHGLSGDAKWPDKKHITVECSVARGDGVPKKTMMGELPYVCTRGGGQNGKKIEGFLYKYHKGEEIRIVCACHGNFLSPAEFVKHGGGGDVEHPLRHIVVNPFPPFLR